MGKGRILSDYLESVRQVLLVEGFEDTMLQIVKPGQVFGLVKRLSPEWEMHVRGFENGVLESEIEVSRDYFEHLDDRFCKDATSELVDLLERYGIPYRLDGTLPQIAVKLEAPKTLTPWKPVALLGAIVVLLIYLSRRR